MARNEIKNDGTLDPIVTNLAASELAEFVLWNHTGSTLVVEQDNLANIAIQVHRDNGVSLDVTGSFSLAPDKAVHLVVINNEATVQNVTLTFKGAHSSISNGTKHTPAATNFPGVYMGEI